MIETQSNSESTSVWDHKPSWCQPWSIILAGLTIISASWLVLHTIWITAGVSILITVWWVYFLILYPKAFADYIISQTANR
ncbi:DUF6737 family protein [Pleurocapsa sp. FMAR1]|uniref:DUF6737 family protein n=1 Tax=Pleurocapsa sp. FMAR1 TaxID=3040204 RepID=UPI0029C8596A|nr:DUF6737 family protein [Pleurocapsa sp. FMAR1]